MIIRIKRLKNYFQFAYILFTNRFIFFEEWYISRNPTVSELVTTKQYQNALWHYLLVGAKSGFNPNPYFYETWYLENNVDVAQTIKTGEFLCGFQHFLINGRFEKRDPSPYFSYENYFYDMGIPEYKTINHREDPFLIFIKNKFQENPNPILQENSQEAMGEFNKNAQYRQPDEIINAILKMDTNLSKLILLQYLKTVYEELDI